MCLGGGGGFLAPEGLGVGGKVRCLLQGVMCLFRRDQGKFLGLILEDGAHILTL